MYNKKILAAASAALICCLSLAACGGSDSSDQPFVYERDTLIIATGASTGAYYAFGTALAQTLGSHTDYSFQVQSTGGSQANILKVAAGDADLALAQNDIADYACNGTELFDGEKVPGFSAVGACYTEVCQIVASRGIDSVDELEGATVCVGDEGSGASYNAKQILGCFGLSESSVNEVHMSLANAVKALSNGEIDALFFTAGAPTAAINELLSSTSARLLGIDDEHASELIAAYPFFTRCTVSAGTYDAVESDVATVAVKATLIVSDSLSSDAVYAITKALFTYSSEIEEAYPKGAQLSADFAISGVTVPFHPGAERYYKEIGVM